MTKRMISIKDPRIMLSLYKTWLDCMWSIFETHGARSIKKMSWLKRFSIDLQRWLKIWTVNCTKTD